MCHGFQKRNLFLANALIIIERDIFTYGNHSLNLRSIPSEDIHFNLKITLSISLNFCLYGYWHARI